MTKDLNKGISSISYNSLNLPRIVDIKNMNTEGRNEYTYSASGQKLRAVQKWNPNYNTAPVIGSDVNVSTLTNSSTTDYVGNIIYENNALKRILVDGGYYENGNYYFYVNDHLGNNRVVADAAASVVQSTQYYPFGSSLADASGISVQPYKYNGKELDTRNGLNTHDFLTRSLGSDLPVFRTPDWHAENYYTSSPYAYVLNNPMKYIDPLGTDTIHVNPDGSAQRYPDGSIVMQPGGDENVFIQDQDLSEVVYTYNRPVKSPYDYWAVSLSGSAILGAGFYGEITIGIIGEDGIFIQPSLGFGFGYDISGSANIKEGVYSGKGKPTAKSLEGLSRDISLGASFVNVGLSQDGAKNPNFVRMERPYNYGTFWNTYSGGVSFGSKSIVGGHFGLGNTLGTHYLYKK